MSFIWTLLGTIGQLALAGFLFVYVGFSGASIADRHNPGPLVLSLLDASIYVVPGVCVVSAALVIYLHHPGASAAAYAWYLPPVLLGAAYVVWSVLLTQHR